MQDPNLEKLRLEITDLYQKIRQKRNQSLTSPSSISAPLSPGVDMPTLSYSREPVLGKSKKQQVIKSNPCASPIHAKSGFFSSMLQETSTSPLKTPPKTPPRVEKPAPSSPYSPIGPGHR